MNDSISRDQREHFHLIGAEDAGLGGEIGDSGVVAAALGKRWGGGGQKEAEGGCGVHVCGLRVSLGCGMGVVQEKEGTGKSPSYCNNLH